MLNFEKAKNKARIYLDNRHLYVGSIIQEIYKPDEYQKICEVGAGDLSLAKYLSESYKSVDAYESLLIDDSCAISNLHLYGYFSKHVNIKQYDLLVSICPYYFESDMDDSIDPEEQTMDLMYEIVDLCIENNIDLFLILSNTAVSQKFYKEISNKDKYNKIISDMIELYYTRMNEVKISNNQVLLLKK